MTAYVRIIGGTVVADEVGRSPNFDNVDYLFRNQSLVAELKCLSEDKKDDPGIQAKIEKLIDEFVDAGRIPNPGAGPFLLNSKDYPLDFQRALYKILSLPIRRRLEKANKQLKETKRHLCLDGFHGLVLLANDGNYGLEPAQLNHAVKTALGGNFSAIDSVILFTANLLSVIPGDEKHALMWVVGEREGHPSPPHDFLNRFYVGWARHIGEKIGEEIPLVEGATEKTLEAMKYDVRLSRSRHP